MLNQVGPSEPVATPAPQLSLRSPLQQIIRFVRLVSCLVAMFFKAVAWVAYWRWYGLRRRLGWQPPVSSLEVGPHETGGASCVGPLRNSGDEETFYLTRQEAEGFEANGYIAPFSLLSADEAAALLAGLRSEITPDRLLFGHEIREFLGQRRFDHFARRGGLQGVHGHWQHLHQKPLADVLRRPELTHRLASILGEDVLCWRSQFFERKPGADGTPWHQASTFQEGGRLHKLEPTVDLGTRPIQLTAWRALTDCTGDNGCMRSLRGSHHDSYVVDREADIADNPERAAARIWSRMSFREQCGAAKIFALPSPFPKAKLLIDHIVLHERPGFFDTYEAVDLEMKAGEMIIFTSLAVHGSHPNSTTDQTRVSFAGRFTTNDVRVYGGHTHDAIPPVLGKNFLLSLHEVGCVQVHGEDRLGLNKILPMPE